MRKLYIVEGIPGSGKTTFARSLASELSGKYGAEKVQLYIEGDLHPADMAWCALLTKEEYDQLIRENTEFAACIEANTVQWRDKFTVAYTKVDDISQELYDYFESKEVYDNRVSKEIFCGIHEDRWTRFGQQAENISIFECSLMQNAINELRLFHDESENGICTYIQKLLASVQNLSPEIIYLDVKPSEAINRAAVERTDDFGNRVWMERVIEYVCDSPFGKKQGYHGLQGMIEYFAYRQQLEIGMLKQLPVRTTLLQIEPANQQEQVRLAIKRIVQSA